MGLFYDCGNGFSSISFAKMDMGCDAYLCCPGPSLKLVDPNKIRGKGRKIFSINTTYPYIKPDVWLGMDKIECYDRNLLYEPFIKIFRGPLYKEMFFDGKHIGSYPDVYWARIKEPEEGKTMFNYREHKTHFVWHKSTLMVAIHVMIWMGARNIYLAGCDLGGTEDYYNGKKLTPEQRKYNRRLYASQVNHLKSIVEEGKKRGINFYSITPNSPINTFMEYYSVDDAIKRSEEKTFFKEEDLEIKHVLDVPRPITVVSIYNSKTKYTDEYVYKFKKSLNKYLPKMKFICLTDKDSIEGVETKKIKYNWGENFNKIELFEHFKEGRFLFIELGSIIKGNLAHLTRFKKFSMIKDFINPNVRSGAVIGWEGDYSFIIDKFKDGLDENIKKYTPNNNERSFSGKEWKSCYDDKFIQDVVGLDKMDSWNRTLVSSYKLSNKDWIENSLIVHYHGNPKPHEVNWDIYKKKIKKNKINNQSNEILHITNWGIWGGVQSVVLSISKEFSEYNHTVYSINSKNETNDCINNFNKNNITYKSFNGVILEEDVIKIKPKLIFLHSTASIKLENGGKWLKNYNTIRVHHGWNLGPLDVDLNWFVSDFVYSKLNYPISKHFILPPVTYVKDYLNVERPERKPVVGRIQSQTHIGGKPFPQTFYDLMDKLDTNLFIVGPKDPSIKNIIRHNNIEAGKMVEYLKEVDLFVIWQDKIETWCLVATEANLSGIPVVARRMNDGLTEQLNKSGGGILVDTEEEFIDAVNKLLKDDQLRNKMAIKGKDWLVENANTKLLRGYIHKLLNE